MTASPPLQTRRGAITAGLITSVLISADAEARSTGKNPSQGITGGPDDWAFLVGRWNVRHRRLKRRLVGDTQWEDFAGTCVNWPLMDGLSNVDDNVLELPGGTYRGVGVRAFNPATRQWSIWWIDARRAVMDPPVRGGFKDGVGVFLGDDTTRAGRSSRASAGRRSPPARPSGIRPSRPTAARPGRPTG